MAATSRPNARRRIAAACLTCSCVVVASCGDDEDPTVPCGSSIERIELAAGEPITLTRLGSVELVTLAFLDACDAPIAPGTQELTWSSSAPDVASFRPVEGAPQPTGVVRAVDFGTAEISVSLGEARGELRVDVVKPATAASGFTVLGGAEVGLFTTDVWVHGQYAYHGSQPWECPDGCEVLEGWLYVWRLLAGGGFERLDSIALPAAKINDVKVSADGSFAVASQELGGPEQNGIVVLDLADPAAPTLASHFSESLESGVHNVWIERIDGRDYVFVADDGDGADGGLHIVDVTDRTAPTAVAHFYAGSSIVHDVYVRDGLAFVSHWNAGLVILDVGNGVAGGSPGAPVEVGRVVTEGGNVHNAWYWPEARKVFVGEERFPPRDMIEQVGVVHVVDVSDLANPTEVARFGVPGSSPHNFWLDEENGVLFVAWYTNGLRALDVNGTLAGDLAAQGRERGFVLPSGPRGAANLWAPQLHQGRIYLSDIQNGLWSVRFDGG